MRHSFLSYIAANKAAAAEVYGGSAGAGAALDASGGGVNDEITTVWTVMLTFEAVAGRSKLRRPCRRVFRSVRRDMRQLSALEPGHRDIVEDDARRDVGRAPHVDDERLTGIDRDRFVKERDA